jgi:hypothetical protein
MYILNLRSYKHCFVKVCGAVSRESELCSASDITAAKSDRFNIFRPACIKMQQTLASITYLGMKRIGRCQLSVHTDLYSWFNILEYSFSNFDKETRRLNEKLRCGIETTVSLLPHRILKVNSMHLKILIIFDVGYPRSGFEYFLNGFAQENFPEQLFNFPSRARRALSKCNLHFFSKLFEGTEKF